VAPAWLSRAAIRPPDAMEPGFHCVRAHWIRVSGRERISHFDAGPGDARGMRLAESLTAGGKGAGPKPPDYRRTRSECERAGLP